MGFREAKNFGEKVMTARKHRGHNRSGFKQRHVKAIREEFARAHAREV
jgi:hypothetical protein